jgi:CBS domain-containing protein
MIKDITLYLRTETVAELEPPVGLRVPPTATIRDTVALMQQHRTGCALVCEGKKLLGIFTEQDYVRRVVGQKLSPETPIRQCMSAKPGTVRANDSVATLVQRIHQGNYRRLPVVDEQGELVGCVSVRNLVHHLAEHFPAAVYNVAPVSKPIQHDREGA